jgi:hypothetical protein
MRLLRFSLILATVLPLTAFAQRSHWKDVSQPNWSPQFHLCPFFLNADIGFTFVPAQVGEDFQTSQSAFAGGLTKTTDGGHTWSPIAFFDTVNIVGAGIAEMSFVTLNHGYAATIPSIDYSPKHVQHGSGGLYETTDQGEHWKLITDTGRFRSVYATGTSVFAVERVNADTGDFGIGLLLQSHDAGRTWDTVHVRPIDYSSPPSGAYLFDFGFFQVTGNRDSLVASMYFDSSGASFLIYTTNLGRDWSSIKARPSAPSQQFCLLRSIPHSCDLIQQFAAPLDGDSAFTDNLDDEISFLRSSFDYRSWAPSLMHEQTGWFMAGNRCSLYICYSPEGDTSNREGLMRSTDQGATWQLIDGPYFAEIDDGDFANLSVVGYGSVVYAIDSPYVHFEHLVKTTDGGDGSLSASSLSPRLFLDRSMSSGGRDTLLVGCNGGVMTLYDQNIRCAYTTFQSITIDSLDPKEYVVSRTHHAACLNLPDTTTIAIPSLPDGIWTTRIHAHYVDDEFAETDTSFTVTIISKTSGASLKAIALIRTASVSARTGDTIDGPLYLSGIPSNISLQLSAATIQTFRLSFSTSLLKPTTFNSMIAGASGSIVGIGQNEVELSIKLRQSVSINGQTLIGVLRCVVQPSTINETRILLTHATINSGDTNCILTTIPEDEGILFTVSASAVRETAHHAMSLMLIPNPATNELTVNVGGSHTSVHCEIIDALGITQIQRVADGTDLLLNVSSLAQGVYFLRVIDSYGTSVTKTLVITR